MSLSAQLAGLWRQAKGWIAGRVPANTENGSVKIRSVTRTPAKPANLYPSPAQTASVKSAGTQPARRSGEGLAEQKATEERWAALLSDKPINQSGAAAQTRPQTDEERQRIARIRAEQERIKWQWEETSKGGGTTQVRPQTDEDIARVKRIIAQKNGRKLVFPEDKKDSSGAGATQRMLTIPFGDEHDATNNTVTTKSPSDDEKEQREREDASAVLTRRFEAQTRNQQQVEQMLLMQGNGSVASPNDPEREKRKLKFFEDNQPTPVRGDPKHTRNRPRTFSR